MSGFAKIEGDSSRSADHFEELRHLLILGKYFSSFESPANDWLVRRVDTAELLDSEGESSSTRTSLMIDGRVVSKIKCSARVREACTYIPLVGQRKRLLGRFDARCREYAIPVVSRIDNSHIAVGVILYNLTGGESSTRHSLKQVSAKLDGRVIDTLYTLASCDPASKTAQALRTAIEHSSGSDDELLDKFTNYYGSLSIELLEIVGDIFDLIAYIEDTQNEESSEELSRILLYYLENFVQIGILEELPESEFLVKLNFSSDTIVAHPSANMPDPSVDNLPRITRGRFALLVLLIGGLYVSNWGWIASAIAGILLFLSLFHEFWKLRKHGTKWLIGAFSYSTYTDLVHDTFSSLRLSGHFTLRSADTNIGLRGSQHFRLAIPRGVQAVDASLYNGDRDYIRNKPNILADWVAAHSSRSDTEGVTLDLRVDIIPSGQSFIRQSLYAASVTVLLLVLGVVSHLLGEAMAQSKECVSTLCPDYGVAHLAVRSSGAIVTVLAIAPSIYVLILLQKDEHQFVSMIYQGTRRVIGFCALTAASVAIPLALDLPTQILFMWWIISLLSAVFACWHIAATRFYHGTLLHSMDLRSPGLQDPLNDTAF